MENDTIVEESTGFVEAKKKKEKERKKAIGLMRICILIICTLIDPNQCTTSLRWYLFTRRIREAPKHQCFVIPSYFV
jgi:hypothetical protein